MAKDELTSIAEMVVLKDYYVVVLMSKTIFREKAFKTKESAIKYAKKRKSFFCIANPKKGEMYDINGNVIYKGEKTRFEYKNN